MKPFFFVFATFFTSSSIFAGTITLNTAALESSSAGPFTLDFQFIEGNGIGDSNNTILLQNFNLGGGSVTTAPGYPIGGVTVGSAPLSITMTDSSFFNEVQLSLIPGLQVAFDFSSTANADDVAPDSFTFAILDGSGNEISTTNPNANNAFVEVDLPSGSAGVNTILSGSADGASVTLAAPTQSSGATAPEPATYALACSALTVVIFARRSRASSRRC